MAVEKSDNLERTADELQKVVVEMSKEYHDLRGNNAIGEERQRLDEEAAVIRKNMSKLQRKVNRMRKAASRLIERASILGVNRILYEEEMNLYQDDQDEEDEQGEEDDQDDQGEEDEQSELGRSSQGSSSSSKMSAGEFYSSQGGSRF